MSWTATKDPDLGEGHLVGFDIGSLRVGPNEPLLVISGPCVIESRDQTLEIAEALKEICNRVGASFIFKSSYDKANRTSMSSYRGPGLEFGLEILAWVKEKLGLKIVSDVHCRSEIGPASRVLDVIQIPAFLCRQTDLLVEAARTGLPINVKKGQFLSPWDISPVVDKILSAGNKRIMVSERGTCFGYNNLVVDFRSLVVLRKMGLVTIFDATHSVQLPGGLGTRSGGQRQFIEPLARAAVAVGVEGVFLEVHPDPDRALCDGPNSLPLRGVEALLRELVDIHELSKRKPCS